MLNPAALHEAIHMMLAAYAATGFMVAGVHAFFLLRNRESAFHRNACGIPLAVACVAIPLQFLARSERSCGREIPAGQARGDGAHFETAKGAPLIVAVFPTARKSGLIMP